MAEIITYMTSYDADNVREWINGEPDIVWIVKKWQKQTKYYWIAINEVESIAPGSYCLWHKGSQALTIPSGKLDVKDTLIHDPFQGWEQDLDHQYAEKPWFGALAPGPFNFHFQEKGKQGSSSVARSGFNWLGDYFRLIGKPADQVSRQWWQRLRRFVKKETVGIPWPPGSEGRNGAYVFPEAYLLYKKGYLLDANP